ncbi:hypothetical protein DRE_00978 [Drechslerella stenobrocha 248]|uniref:N-acetyltransferase domain-containing protein n=1 Tax=Drechslerella stenobrocha 248 TaxID=1043628 RepID=W7HP37_9PEZI|nr:hypothetical protein DRE_00978 [Drechslerella stenobrocha 248]
MTLREPRPSDLPDILAINAAALANYAQAQFTHPFRHLHPAAFECAMTHGPREKLAAAPDGTSFNIVLEDPETHSVVAWGFWRRNHGPAFTSKIDGYRALAARGPHVQDASDLAIITPSGGPIASAPNTNINININIDSGNSNGGVGEQAKPRELEMPAEVSPSASPARVRLSKICAANDALAHFAHPHWYLSHLLVHPAHKRKGYGTTLTLWGMQRARADGLPCLLTASIEGEKLYSRLGWRVIGRRTLPRLEDMPEAERAMEERLLGKAVVEEQFTALPPSVMAWGDRVEDYAVLEADGPDRGPQLTN